MRGFAGSGGGGWRVDGVLEDLVQWQNEGLSQDEDDNVTAVRRRRERGLKTLYIPHAYVSPEALRKLCSEGWVWLEEVWVYTSLQVLVRYLLVSSLLGNEVIVY